MYCNGKLTVNQILGYKLCFIHPTVYVSTLEKYNIITCHFVLNDCDYINLLEYIYTNDYKMMRIFTQVGSTSR